MLISCVCVCVHVRERERQCGGREEREIGAGRPSDKIHI